MVVISPTQILCHSNKEDTQSLTKTSVRLSKSLQSSWLSRPYSYVGRVHWRNFPSGVGKPPFQDEDTKSWNISSLYLSKRVLLTVFYVPIKFGLLWVHEVTTLSNSTFSKILSRPDWRTILRKDVRKDSLTTNRRLPNGVTFRKNENENNKKKLIYKRDIEREKSKSRREILLYADRMREKLYR